MGGLSSLAIRSLSALGTYRSPRIERAIAAVELTEQS